MPDITISTDPKQEEKKPVQESDIKEVLKAADDYKKLKDLNDKIEQEVRRGVELMKAREVMGGRSTAGQVPKEESPEEKAKREAAEALKPFI